MDDLPLPTDTEIFQKLKSIPEFPHLANLFFILPYIIALIGMINIFYRLIQIKKKHINPLPSKNIIISLNFSHLILIILINNLLILSAQLIVRLFYKLPLFNISEELPGSVNIVIDLIVKIIIILFLLFLIKKLTRHPFKEIGFSRYNLFNQIKNGILTIISITPILLVIIFINSEILRLNQVAPIVKIIFASSNIYTQIVMIINIIIISPIAEEILFRYLLNGCLKKELGVWLSIFLGGMIFAALHFDSSSFLPLAILGIGLSYIYELKRSIIIVIAAHSLFNLASLIMLYVIKFLFHN